VRIVFFANFSHKFWIALYIIIGTLYLIVWYDFANIPLGVESNCNAEFDQLDKLDNEKWDKVGLYEYV